jgi:hypothetical protein
VSDLVPVFVGGCPRSGTTLLGAILGAHSACVCVPEAAFKIEVLRGRPAGADAAPLAREILMSREFQLWGLDARVLEHEVDAMAHSYADVLRWLVRHYARTVARKDARWWIDHTPLNARYAPSLDRHFPDAKFVHIVRDGRGVAASVLPLDWGPNTVERAARWWAEEAASGLALESWDPRRVMRVKYEDLVEDCEPTIRRLSDFVGLEFEPAMLRADGFSLGFPSRQHALVGSPPRADRARAWAATLSQRQVEIFEAVAGDLLVTLGYEPRFGIAARPPSRLERARAMLAEIVRDRLVNRRRARRRLESEIRQAAKATSRRPSASPAGPRGS